VLAHPGYSCGIDPVETVLNKFPTATLLPSVFRADGLCENATEPFLGLSFPAWAGLGFAVFAVVLAVSLLRRRL
jgi:disulfide bond formation protein DsbB